MTSFSARWLAMREPYDRRARNAAVLDAVAAAFRERTSVAVIDLACGTGATLRALGPRLPPKQNWRLVDNDLGLLAKAATPDRPPELVVTAEPADLARDLERAFDRPADLVTASALLDLVSLEWLERLVVETAVHKLPLYAALSYDGRVTLAPTTALDADIITAVNRHQEGDKGFGPALGPQAATQCVTLFKRLGYSVKQGRADWTLTAEDRSIQLEVLAGWADAAQSLGDLPRSRVAAWLSRRRELVESGRSSMRVGHVDIFAAPTETRSAETSQSSKTSPPRR
jgi:hypothetical protein